MMLLMRSHSGKLSPLRVCDSGSVVARRIRQTALAMVCVLLALIVPASAGGSPPTCWEEASPPLAAANGAGETLVAWGDSCDYEEGFPLRANARVAIGNVKTGFTNFGSISSSGRVVLPASVSIDDAGDSWVMGFDAMFERRGKYGGLYQDNTGVWFSFRPAHGAFQVSTGLPTGGTLIRAAFVASNRVGATVLAWTTLRGTYVAWGTPTGKISKPHFIGHRFEAIRVGVDNLNRALIVGAYPDTTIATVSGRLGHSFSRIQKVASPLNDRRNLRERFGEPLVAIGVRGDAFITWETNWEESEGGEFSGEFEGPTERVYRRPDGYIVRTAGLSRALFGYAEQGAGATVDRVGATVVLRPIETGYEVIALSPSGRVRSRLRPPNSSAWRGPNLAGNEYGKAVIGWSGPCNSCVSAKLVNTRGTRTASRTFTTQYEVPIGAVTMTVDPQGSAAAIWMEKGVSQSGIYAINARAIEPGGQTVLVGAPLTVSGGQPMSAALN
jgi:hypothetical protein